MTKCPKKNKEHRADQSEWKKSHRSDFYHTFYKFKFGKELKQSTREQTINDSVEIEFEILQGDNHCPMQIMKIVWWHHWEAETIMPDVNRCESQCIKIVL